MSWTAPRTWTAGEIPTAALFNAQIKDNLLEEGPAKITTAGDFLVGAGASQLKRIAIGTVGDALVRGTSGALGWGSAGIPPGILIYYDGTSCPAGWTERTTARGRVLVGLPASGTLGGTVATALTNLGTRSMSTPAAHTHGFGTLAAASGGGSHSHGSIALGPGGGGGNALSASSTTAGSIASQVATHTHAVTGSTTSSGSITDVTMPYIQYLICEKD